MKSFKNINYTARMPTLTVIIESIYQAVLLPVFNKAQNTEMTYVGLPFI